LFVILALGEAILVIGADLITATTVRIAVAAWDGCRAGEDERGIARPAGTSTGETIHARGEDSAFAGSRA
jgi:hypothetical protein